MPDRKPAAWKTNTPGPFLTIKRAHGTVAVSALGPDRFRVQAPGHEEEVVGYDRARERAHELALELDQVAT
jgi:hypothetical protein